MPEVQKVKYAWTTNGTAAGDQTWEASGTVDIAPGDFTLAIDVALRSSFQQLTQGKAVFGHPGLGCDGPYHIVKFTIELSA